MDQPETGGRGISVKHLRKFLGATVFAVLAYWVIDQFLTPMPKIDLSQAVAWLERSLSSLVSQPVDSVLHLATPNLSPFKRTYLALGAVFTVVYQRFVIGNDRNAIDIGLRILLYVLGWPAGLLQMAVADFREAQTLLAKTLALAITPIALGAAYFLLNFMLGRS